MESKRTSDLADEGFGLKSSRTGLTKVRDFSSHGFPVTESLCGGSSYRTVTSGRIWQGEIRARERLCKAIADSLSHYGMSSPVTTLAVGLGSSTVTADSLGPMTVDRLLISGGCARLCAIKPGVPARTGIDTSAAVYAIAEQVNARLILTVDSLSAVSSDRLCTVIQITDGGVTPGSALSHSSGEISERTMPCPVISIGVPTVIRAELLSGRAEDEGLLVSPAEVDAAVSCYASVIAGGINLAHVGNIVGQVIGAGENE